MPDRDIKNGGSEFSHFDFDDRLVFFHGAM